MHQLVQKGKKLTMEADNLITFLTKNLKLENRKEGLEIANRLADDGFFLTKKVKDKKLTLEIGSKYLPIHVFEKPLYFPTPNEAKFNFLAIPAEEIARQLTLIDLALFKYF